MGELVVSGMNWCIKEVVVRMEIDLREVDRREKVFSKVRNIKGKVIFGCFLEVFFNGGLLLCNVFNEV